MIDSSTAMAAETHELYLHILNLRQPNGESATDSNLLHREIVNAPEGLATQLNPETLAGFCSGAQAVGPAHLAAIRTVLDRAHLRSVNPKFWRPRWLKTRQSTQFLHPRIPNHELHHHSST